MPVNDSLLETRERGWRNRNWHSQGSNIPPGSPLTFGATESRFSWLRIRSQKNLEVPLPPVQNDEKYHFFLLYLCLSL